MDVIIQRYVSSKGIKASKIRITMGKSVKILKFINKHRQDLKKDICYEPKPEKNKSQRPKNVQKNMFNDIAEDNKQTSPNKISDIISSL